MSRIEIPTAIDGFTLRELVIDDADDYYHLVDVNRAHLSGHGDYIELQELTLESARADLAEQIDDRTRVGGWYANNLVGRFDLIPRAPTNFVLGYWLGQAYTGRGLATAGCRALIKYGQDQLGATDVWAGVTNGNDPSVAVLDRLGFKMVKDMGAYTRYHLSLLK